MLNIILVLSQVKSPENSTPRHHKESQNYDWIFQTVSLICYLHIILFHCLSLILQFLIFPPNFFVRHFSKLKKKQSSAPVTWTWGIVVDLPLSSTRHCVGRQIRLRRSITPFRLQQGSPPLSHLAFFSRIQLPLLPVGDNI